MKQQNPMKIAVIGCGRWGSFIAWYLDTLGHEVTLYGRENSAHMQQFLQTRSNNLLTLPERIQLSTDIECVKKVHAIVISVHTQGLQQLMEELAPMHLRNKYVVLCMKGLEIATGRRLSQIAEDNLDPSNKIAVWIGPGHVQEFYARIPSCMVIDSRDTQVKGDLIHAFSGPLIRFYYGEDLIGNEIGAASKNVMGIAAGMLDGLGLTSLKGAMMARGTHEIARLIGAMGGNELSAYGLCHLGDYEATIFSKYSHNRRFGEAFVNGEKFEELAEGYYTVKALVELEEKLGIELPICHAVYKVLYEGADPKAAVGELFARQLTTEFSD